MIRIEGLTKSYDSGFILDVGDRVFPTGKITAVLGPNGSGKSTLLRLIAGIESADSGRIGMDGMTVTAGSPPPDGWRRAVTMVMQKPFMFSGSVATNVGFGLKLRGVSRRRRAHEIDENLQRIGLTGWNLRNARELSEGEAQMVALARALALDTRVLLLDEPTAHVDRDNARFLENLIASLGSVTGTTVILATHNLEQAYRLSGEVVSLIGGKLVEVHPENVFIGAAERSREGLTRITLRGGARIEADTPLSGRVHVAIDPTDIIVSREKLLSSARNCLPGRLVSATSLGNLVRLSADAGAEFSVLVTENSFREMGLHPGDMVYLTFKSTAVKVF